MSTHTPGPWTVWSINPGSLAYWGLRGPTGLAPTLAGPEGEANARLMAAAPELLEALRLAMNDMEEMAYSAVTYAAVKAAWEKATGGTTPEEEAR